jgi:Putative amidoligase enzyme
MNLIDLIQEASVDDAVTFNDTLNPALWENNQLKLDVRVALLKIAKNFFEFINLPNMQLLDITISGSNASYTYTEHSDIDLHLIADLSGDCSGELMELYTAKKSQWNDMHNVKIKGFDVEVYVQDIENPVVSNGIYSVLDGKWHKEPVKQEADIDDMSVMARVEFYAKEIDAEVKGTSLSNINKLTAKIKDMRKNGLSKTGEFGPENLAFKVLRANGYIDRLWTRKSELEDEQLSLTQEESLLDEEIVDEVNMSPGALKAFANTPYAAENVVVGFEAEMTVPDLSSGEDDEDIEYENDYDYDEPFPTDSGWVDTLVDFFTSGDFSSSSRRDVQRAADDLLNDYGHWIEDDFNDYLSTGAGKSELRTKIREDEIIDSELWDQACEDLGIDDETNHTYWKAYKNSLSDKEERARIIDKDDYAEVFLKFKKLQDEELSRIMDEQDDKYDSAMHSIRDEYERDNDKWSDFLSSQGMRRLSDFNNVYDLGWPYMEVVGGGREAGSIDGDSLARELSQALDGVKVVYSDRYHSETRTADKWILEPDSSIDADSGYGGIEFISPPMNLPVALEKLDTFFKWAKSYGVETNQSTGFHVGVSMKNFSMLDIDKVKLILLLGDQYVLDQFDRASNTYAKSSLDKVGAAIQNWTMGIDKNGPETLLSKFRGGLNDIASKFINQALTYTNSQKYVSVHVQNEYIEFRSAGGDWMAKQEQIMNTILRYVRAFVIASDPEAYKKEYAKKLYKIIYDNSPFKDDIVQYFAQYAAGEIPLSALKSNARHIRDIRKAEKEKKSANKKEVDNIAKELKNPEEEGRWEAWNGYNEDNELVERFSAKNPQMAIRLANNYNRYGAATGEIHTVVRALGGDSYLVTS